VSEDDVSATQTMAVLPRSGRPISTARAGGCGDQGSDLWRTGRRSVEDSPELGVCERNGAKALVALGSEPLELSSRSSSGESGIGRRRRSVQCLGGLPARGCGGQVTGSLGSEEPAGSTGSVTSTGQAVNRRATDLCRGTMGHHRRALVAHTYEGPSPISEHAGEPGAISRSARHRTWSTRRCSTGPRPSHRPHWSGPLLNNRASILWTAARNLWTGGGRVVDHPEEIAKARNPPAEPLVVGGPGAIELLPRTPSGESGIGRRRRSAPPPPGLPGGSGGGRVTRPPGSEEPTGSTGSVTSTGRVVNRRTPASCRGPTDHQPKGPCRSYRQGPFNYFPSPRRETSPA
jgi:hypothetical protein